MKRATLSAYPTSPGGPAADLTDRLLAADDAPARSVRPAPAKPGPARATRARRAAPAATPAAPAAPEALPDSLETALAAADAAALALRQASGEAPARYDVALRYRLDALAHHLQQVKEFVAGLAAR